jgi:hypothetical protein
MGDRSEFNAQPREGIAKTKAGAPARDKAALKQSEIPVDMQPAGPRSAGWIEAERISICRN